MGFRGTVLMLGLTACGPVVSAPGQSADSSTSETTAATTVATVATVDGSGTTSADADSTTEAPPEGLCLYGISLTGLPSFDWLEVVDSDGNGRDELWLRGAGIEPGSSRISAYELGDGPAATSVLELERPGIVSDMVDIDGDGLHDFIVLEDGAPAWWLAGLPGPLVDELAQPLDVPDTYGSWLDADGDGPADWLESAEELAVLHKGDGTGAFTPTGTLDYGGKFGGVRGWASGIPGRPLVVFQLGSLDVPTQTMWGVEVSPAGEITVLASGPIGFTSIRHVSDLDGDMIPDALGFNVYPDLILRYIHQARPGVYESEDTSVPIQEMVAGSFVTASEVDVLYWSDEDESQAFLRPLENGGWGTEIPVTLVGPWESTGKFRTMQADGEGGLEILQQSYENDERIYLLWTLEPCH